MSTNHITRVQPGVPSGGQFTATGHAEAGVSLGADPAASIVDRDSTEAVEALAAAELAYRAANVRFHAAVDARDYQGTEEAGEKVFVARDALLVARDAVHNPAREGAADALEALDAAENAYSNASLAHTDTRTVESRQAVTDALNVFITARQVVRDLTGTPTYRR